MCFTGKRSIFQPTSTGPRTRMSMELSNYLVSWVFHLLRGRNEPTYIGVIIYLQSTMDILVPSLEIAGLMKTIGFPLGKGRL